MPLCACSWLDCGSGCPLRCFGGHACWVVRARVAQGRGMRSGEEVLGWLSFRNKSINAALLQQARWVCWSVLGGSTGARQHGGACLDARSHAHSPLPPMQPAPTATVAPPPCCAGTCTHGDAVVTAGSWRSTTGPPCASCGRASRASRSCRRPPVRGQQQRQRQRQQARPTHPRSRVEGRLESLSRVCSGPAFAAVKRFNALAVARDECLHNPRAAPRS